VFVNESVVCINKNDTVAVALKDLTKGKSIVVCGQSIKLKNDIERGHKINLNRMAEGSSVIKYGYPIGQAKKALLPGQHVHVHNMETSLTDKNKYMYEPEKRETFTIPLQSWNGPESFLGYKRENGSVGIRNELWIIPTVGCVNRIAVKSAEKAHLMYSGIIDGVYAFTHPYGCSQLGDDHKRTQKILADLVHHPNAGAVLVLGLGCENNNIKEFKPELGRYNSDRVKFISVQDVKNEDQIIEKTMADLFRYMKSFSRQECSLDTLTVGLKCGGSDGLSGITANPLVGLFSDWLIGKGGCSILTEVPEMFGAESILMNRAQNESVFNKTVRLIQNFKDYYIQHNQKLYENPSPGNRDGGITTLEEKSLGCIQKGGSAPVVDVLSYGETVKTTGLQLLNGPGNDLVSTTALTAAGSQLILFTTGRGNPLGAPAPSVKISSNDALFQKKRHWIDFNAGNLLHNNMQETLKRFVTLVCETASGKRTKSEINETREIALFKDGVIL